MKNRFLSRPCCARGRSLPESIFGLLSFHIALVGLKKFGWDAVVGNGTSDKVAQDYRGIRCVQNEVGKLTEKVVET